MASSQVERLKVAERQDSKQTMTSNKYQKFEHLDGDFGPGEQANKKTNNNLRDLLNVRDFAAIERQFSLLKKTPIGYLSVPSAAPMDQDENRRQVRGSTAPSDAPLLAGATTNGGRPLSQAAASRAKFAIRSYTISVSGLWTVERDEKKGACF